MYITLNKVFVIFSSNTQMLPMPSHKLKLGEKKKIDSSSWNAKKDVFTFFKIIAAFLFFKLKGKRT